jgi:hypothetical protein
VRPLTRAVTGVVEATLVTAATLTAAKSLVRPRLISCNALTTQPGACADCPVHPGAGARVPDRSDNKHEIDIFALFRVLDREYNVNDEDEGDIELDTSRSGDEDSSDDEHTHTHTHKHKKTTTSKPEKEQKKKAKKTKHAKASTDEDESEESSSDAGSSASVSQGPAPAPSTFSINADTGTKPHCLSPHAHSTARACNALLDACAHTLIIPLSLPLKWRTSAWRAFSGRA